MNKKFQIKEQYKLINFLFCTSKLVKKKNYYIIIQTISLFSIQFCFLEIKKINLVKNFKNKNRGAILSLQFL